MSGFHFRAAGTGERIAIAGDVYTVLASGAETGGAYSLFDAIVPPGGGPPFHIHEREDEAFYILEGEMTFFTEGKEIVASSGSLVHLPRGGTHRFQNRGSHPARMLIQVTPAGIENYFRKAGFVLNSSGEIPDTLSPEALQRLVEYAPEFGLKILPPA